MNLPRDKKGREILPGDTLKIFHFTGSRGEKHYMYKYVKKRVVIGRCDFYKVLHLNQEGDFYYMRVCGRIHDSAEIVQGYGEDGISFEHREARLQSEKTNFE